MICRVAENCFWIARYVERAATLARLLEVNNAFQLDVHRTRPEVWGPIMIAMGQKKQFIEQIGADAIEDGEAVQEYLTWDRNHPSSIYASLRWARENARTIREVVSVEMWETINDTWLWLASGPAHRRYQRERDEFYDYLSKQCMLIHGVCDSTMLHDERFLFMRLGRAVERVGQTARVLDVKHHSLGDERRDESAADAQCLAILRSFTAVDAFFQRAANVLSGPAVAEFLLFDRAFPRAVLHNLDTARELLARLDDGNPPPTLVRSSRRRLDRLRGSLLQMSGPVVQELGLHKVLTSIVNDTAALCDAIHADYLGPNAEDLLRGARRVRSVAPDISPALRTV